MSSGKKISIFGGTGFIGSRFSELFEDKCNLIERNSREAQESEILFFISTTDNYNVFSNLKVDIETNLSIMMEVLEKLKDKDFVFNFISSWFVYGDTKLPAKESYQCKPKGFYSITKYTAEQLLISFCNTFKKKYRILRLCNVYGLNDKNVSKKKNALQYLISQLKNNEKISLYDGGQFYRDYLYVDDVCRAIEICLNKGPYNSIINIGSGNKYLFKDIIDIAKIELNSQSNIYSIEPPDFHKFVQVKNFYMDVTKLKSFGFKQNYSIKEGIKLLCQT